MLFIAEVEIRHCPPTPHCTSWAPLGSRGSAFRGGNRVLHSAGAPSRVVGSTCLDHRAGDVQPPGTSEKGVLLSSLRGAARCADATQPSTEHGPISTSASIICVSGNALSGGNRRPQGCLYRPPWLSLQTGGTGGPWWGCCKLRGGSHLDSWPRPTEVSSREHRRGTAFQLRWVLCSRAPQEPRGRGERGGGTLLPQPLAGPASTC